MQFFHILFYTPIRIALSYTSRNLRSSRGQVVDVVEIIFEKFDLLYDPSPIIIIDGINCQNLEFPRLI